MPFGNLFLVIILVFELLLTRVARPRTKQQLHALNFFLPIYFLNYCVKETHLLVQYAETAEGLLKKGIYCINKEEYDY